MSPAVLAERLYRQPENDAVEVSPFGYVDHSPSLCLPQQTPGNSAGSGLFNRAALEERSHGMFLLRGYLHNLPPRCEMRNVSSKGHLLANILCTFQPRPDSPTTSKLRDHFPSRKPKHASKRSVSCITFPILHGSNQ